MDWSNPYDPTIGKDEPDESELVRTWPDDSLEHPSQCAEDRHGEHPVFIYKTHIEVWVNYSREAFGLSEVEAEELRTELYNQLKK